MRKTVRLIVVCALVLLPGISIAGERFDGNWLTKMTCPPKGKTEGYSWQFSSVVSGSEAEVSARNRIGDCAGFTFW